MNNNGMKQVSILVTLGVVVLAGIGGSVIVPASGVLILGFTGVITAQLLNMLNQERTAAKLQEATAKVADKAAEAATAVVEVKKTLSAATDEHTRKIDSLAKVTNDTHTLNNKMAIELLAVKELSRWKADSTKLPEHIAAANEAERAYNEHMAKQAVVDAGPRPPT